MNRTFHSKTDWRYWLLMGISAFLLFDFFWFHYTLLTIVMAVCVIFEIEMLIHTCYIVAADGTLRVESGRFVPNRTIDLRSIVSMERVKSYSVAPALSVERVEIRYREEKEIRRIQVSPVQTEEFMAWIRKQKEKAKE